MNAVHRVLLTDSISRRASKFLGIITRSKLPDDIIAAAPCAARQAHRRRHAGRL